MIGLCTTSLKRDKNKYKLQYAQKLAQYDIEIQWDTNHNANDWSSEYVTESECPVPQ